MDDPGPVSGIFYFLCDTQGQDTGRIKWLSRVSFPGATIIPVMLGVICCSRKRMPCQLFILIIMIQSHLCPFLNCIFFSSWRCYSHAWGLLWPPWFWTRLDRYIVSTSSMHCLCSCQGQVQVWVPRPNSPQVLTQKSWPRLKIPKTQFFGLGLTQ